VGELHTLKIPPTTIPRRRHTPNRSGILDLSFNEEGYVVTCEEAVQAVHDIVVFRRRERSYFIIRWTIITIYYLVQNSWKAWKLK